MVLLPQQTKAAEHSGAAARGSTARRSFSPRWMKDSA